MKKIDGSMLSDRMRDVVERSRRTRAEHRAALLARHGWPETVECASCGDTGTVPAEPAGFPAGPCSCPAGQAERERERAAAELAARETYWDDRVPFRFRRYRLAGATDAAAVAAVRAWCDGLPAGAGRNLYLGGPVGTGKTGLAVGALRVVHESGARRYLFCGVPALLDAMRARGREAAGAEDPMTAAVAASVLVLDDLGAERPTDWVAERLYVLVNARYEKQLPTVVTTNLAPDELREAVGARVVSRLVEDCELVLVGGKDRRMP